MVNEHHELWKTQFPTTRVIVVLGNTGTGKTAFCFSILEDSDRNVFVYKFPRKELVLKLNYNMLYSIEDMTRLQDCVVYIDEPQLFLPKYDKKNNDSLLKLISLARQRNITLLLSTSDTRWVNKALESYVDTFVLKDLDYDMAKQGSKIRSIIKQFTFISPEEFKLDVNEYVYYNRSTQELNGKKVFELPLYFSDEHSKAFRLKSAK